MIKITYLLLISLFFMTAFSIAGNVPDKASPFTAVKWDGDQPVVRFNNDWYLFHSINGISVESIIKFCKATYEDRWKKRFSEDFIEVLTKMGHKPDINVSLVLSKDGTKYTKSGVMTEENRDRVRDYNKGEDKPATSQSESKGKGAGETATLSSQTGLAQQMAEWIDQVWEADPPKNAANLRFLFIKNGSPFSGKIDIEGDFVFRATGRQNHIQAFNPNSKGRWVFEEIQPGTYDLSITGAGPFDGWTWSKKMIEIKPDTKPLLEIPLDK